MHMYKTMLTLYFLVDNTRILLYLIDTRLSLYKSNRGVSEMCKRFVITKNGKPYRAYADFGLALFVKGLCEDLKPSCVWEIRTEGCKF